MNDFLSRITSLQDQTEEQLNAANDVKGEQMGNVLVSLGIDLSRVAFLDQGRIQRYIEQEALSANHISLENQ